MRWAENVACVGDITKAYKMSENVKDRPLRRTRHRKENY
jgi:hypothetical protein